MKHMLVVDDDRELATVLAFGLRLHGYGVEVAENGRQALRLQDEQRFDAIVLDWNMPVMGGEEFLEQYRPRALATRAAPVIVLTARPDADEKARKLGAAAVVLKPFNLDELVRVLVSVLNDAE
jgi:two-component system, OmpR family, phosphate regulon response regulator PhoB